MTLLGVKDTEHDDLFAYHLVKEFVRETTEQDAAKVLAVDSGKIRINLQLSNGASYLIQKSIPKLAIKRSYQSRPSAKSISA